jgi:hypothetical protein
MRARGALEKSRKAGGGGATIGRIASRRPPRSDEAAEAAGGEIFRERIGA